ncbi:ARID domain-containing protein [Mycena sanguinolenta]|uniref:ARID domain-containing protein n=1 Tax=Mycena sanguinolenta TaxID=230812 RepID=A0A8H7CJ61_9AGAR|nr:ARID domain-containing protein [Mycena sanguinolenta]
MDPLPPPTYSQEAELSDSSSTSDLPLDPQILIIPSSDSINFQKGYLGADEERAAVEGEIQVKGTESGRWARVQVGFVFPAQSPYGPAKQPFARELNSDFPKSSYSPRLTRAVGSLALVVPLCHPLDGGHTSTRLRSPVSKSLVVHTRRYTAHTHSLVTSPETHTLDDPTRVEVQIPRTTFIAGEAVPLYVTVPPPPRELVVDQGLRLRNVRVELLRIVEVNHDEDKTNFVEELSSSSGPSSGPSTAITPPPADRPPQPSSSKAPVSPLFPGSTFKTVIARSGASCRFHSSRPVQLRFVLHQPSPSASPSDFQINLPTPEYGHLESDAECASITQLTLLHSVTFQVNVHVSFVDMSSRTERISTISIPVVVLAPPAPLPEIAPSMEAAYSKKHDRPPARTVRHEEADLAPHYSEGEAGPSGFSGGAPPPFEERDAPPPFFSYAAEASTSSRLPTFLESETEIIIPPDDHNSVLQHRDVPSAIVGEGVEFGFSAAEQFYGHTEERSSTPPPTLEMVDRDADLTSLTMAHEPEVLGLVLDQHEENSGELPPPPPALDDPSDPPPSIDSSDFRSPDAPTHPPSPSLVPYSAPEPTRLNPPSPAPATGQNHDPPPYLVPGEEPHPHQQEHVARPPPYVD